MLKQLQTLLDDPLVHKLGTVQSLWSGYGEIARYASPKRGSHFIVKQVSPPSEVKHPRGWNTQTSHQRKLMSYQVEGRFYRDYAHLCSPACRVPSFMYLHTNQEDGLTLLVVEDLDQAGFGARYTQLGLNKIKQVIAWLAHFHALYLTRSVEGLWPIGTYWHLATRQDELQKMQPGPLKKAASQIDKILNQAKFQTLVHGDAKLANFCFADNYLIRKANQSPLAAVDFQYVGKGVGVKDLAYFLGSCLNENGLFTHGAALLDEYFSQLQQAISTYQSDVDFVSLEKEWRALYPIVWADFHRFLLGWSPEHFKINRFMQVQTDEVLSILQGRFNDNE